MDQTPTVYAGAKLFFYATGTSTKLDTYSNKGLSIANPNPITLNSAGRSPVDIFLQDLEYKVVLAPATDTDPPTSPILTADPVSHRDSALIAKTLTGSGSPNGSVAGTAGSASILPDFYWDYTAKILYVCTVTGDSSTAVWTAINASSAAAAVPPPQGRLTLTSATPVIATDVVAATAVYYTPFVGNLVPIYNGSVMTPTEFAELTLSLVASHASNTIYDVFVFSNSGVLTLVTGPAWTTSTIGSGARGTGASTTELTRIKGLHVNAVSMTGRNGSTTYSIGANLATYLGSISIDSSAGQITCHKTWGQSRKWGVWNAYNRVPIILQAGDNTSTWLYNNGTTTRAANADANNCLTVFMGLAEEAAQVRCEQRGLMNSSTSSTLQMSNGIGWNVTNAFSGTRGVISTNADVVGANMVAKYLPAPFLGLSKATACEVSTAAGPNCNFFGQEADMNLSASYAG